MRKIKLTQGKFALVDDIDYEYLSQWKWYAAWDGRHFRAVRNSQIDGKRETMHTVIAKRMKIDSKMIDHKNRNSLNNQRSNLRAANKSQNGHNRGPQSNNTTGIKGVSFHKSSGKYRAEIRVKGKYFHLGLFDTISEAEKVLVVKRKELIGEFAYD